MKKVLLLLSILICYLMSFSQEYGTYQDPRDGRVYKVVKIGEQWVMAENFSYRPEFGTYWAYNTDAADVTKYDYRYDWQTANSVVPEGWHIPTQEEWAKLFEHLGGDETKVFNSLKPGGSSGFNAVFSGFSNEIGENIKEGKRVDYWSSTQKNSVLAWSIYFNAPKSRTKQVAVTKSYGLYVRLFADSPESVVISKDNPVGLEQSNKIEKFGTFTDPRDGKVYKTVRIGDQLIMAENLAYKPDNKEYWTFSDDPEYIAKNGYLYDWETAKTIAPDGWHLPTKEELKKLYLYLGNDYEKVYAALNEGGRSGFNVSFGGWRDASGNYRTTGDLACFWSCDGQDREHAWALFCHSSGIAKVAPRASRLGFNVRLIADIEEDLEIKGNMAANQDNSVIIDPKNKAKTLSTIYSRTYFEPRFMSVPAIVFEVITPVFGAAFLDDIDDYEDLLEATGQISTSITTSEQRKNSNEFEMKLGDFDALAYFANYFNYSKNRINNYNIEFTGDKPEHAKVVDLIIADKDKNIDMTFKNDLVNENTKYVSAFKFQYGIGARAGSEQLGMTKTYRPFVRLVGYIKDVDSNSIAWGNSILIFSNKKFNGKNEAKNVNEVELAKEFKRLSKRLVNVLIDDINGKQYVSDGQLVDISVKDNHLK